MDVSALISKSFSNTLKSSERSKNDYSNFNNLLSQVSNRTNESTNNNTKYVKNSQEKSNCDSNNDNIKDNDLRPINKEVQDSLKEAGVSDEDIDKIKDSKDLKSFILKKVLSEKKEDGLDINGLMAILASLMNGNFDKNDMLNLKQKISEEIQKVISDKLADQSSYGSTKELLNQSNSQFIYDILTGKEKIDNNGILAKVKKELSLALKNNVNNLKNKESNSKDLLKDVIAAPKDSNANETENIIKNKEESANYAGSEDKQASSDDDFLKNLLSNNSNDKISKVTNFMTQFNNISSNNTDIADLEKMVINKNTFNADMIKSLKYMETNNIKNLTIKINPKELGEVAINITMESGIMKATITASNKEAYNLLNTNLQDITSKLQNNDIKIQNLSLSIYNDDTTFYKDGSNKQNDRNEQKFKGIRAIDDISSDNIEAEGMDALNSNVNILA